MSRTLLLAVGASAALHASAVAVFPWSVSPGQGLGLGASPPDRSQLPVRMTFTMEIERPLPLPAPMPSPHLPLDLPGQPAAQSEPAEEGLDPRTAQEMLEVHVPPSPPREPAPPPAQDFTRLVFTLPPRPKPEKLAIRVEDVRWNRLVGASIGSCSKLSAGMSGLHGTVRLLLYLTPEGRIRDLRVLDAGPSPALSLAAQAQVRAAEPFPRAPAGMDDRLLRIPLNLHY